MGVVWVLVMRGPKLDLLELGVALVSPVKLQVSATSKSFLCPKTISSLNVFPGTRLSWERCGNLRLWLSKRRPPGGFSGRGRLRLRTSGRIRQVWPMGGFPRILRLEDTLESVGEKTSATRRASALLNSYDETIHEQILAFHLID